MQLTVSEALSSSHGMHRSAMMHPHAHTPQLPRPTARSRAPHTHNAVQAHDHVSSDLSLCRHHCVCAGPTCSTLRARQQQQPPPDVRAGGRRPVCHRPRGRGARVRAVGCGRRAAAQSWVRFSRGAGAGRDGRLALHVRRRRAASDVLAPRNDFGPVRSVRGWGGAIVAGAAELASVHRVCVNAYRGRQGSGVGRGGGVGVTG